MTQLLMSKSDSPWLFSAIQGLCSSAGISASLQTIPAADTTDPHREPPEPVVGLIHWLSFGHRAHFFAVLGSLWKAGARTFVLVTDSADVPWSTLPDGPRAAFGTAFQVVPIFDETSVKTAPRRLQNALGAAAAVRPLPEWAQRRVEATLDASNLYVSLEPFLHGARGDISNLFLAPARLLALANGNVSSSTLEDWKLHWTRLAGGMGQHSSGLLAADLNHALAPVREWLESPAAGDRCVPRSLVPALSRVMTILTDCRVLTGVRSELGRQRTAVARVGPLVRAAATQSADRLRAVAAVRGPSAGFRVLVVDDHAAAWRPVFVAVRGALAEQGKFVDFFFSVDGRHLRERDDEAAAELHFSTYDLLILDIMLEGRDGRDILEEIRLDLLHLPVLIWTTSRDDEITTRAAQANGILLKKTLEWEDLLKAIARWLPEGRAKGAFSLPSPLFNHTIRRKEHRELARDFTDWCLKQLDSFHALDSGYFRYFTDHGGRHIVKLLEYMEQALTPFLTSPREDVLPLEADQRELDVLSLYLAVVAHELGMFPLQIDGNVEAFSRRSQEGKECDHDEKQERYLDNVRSLHALRGMLLFFEDNEFTGKYWVDEEGRKLGVDIHRYGLSARLSTLVGYHSRCLESLTREDFLRWSEPRRFQDLHPEGTEESAALPVMVTGGRLNEVVTRLGSLLSDSAKERLRRQCALLRFVDAIDVASSRNPAGFLLRDTNDVLNRREYLKRQVCQKVDVRDGRIRVEVLAAMPDHGFLKRVCERMPCLQVPNRKKELECLAGSAPRLDGIDLGNLWAPSGRKHVENLQGPVNKWLQGAWSIFCHENARLSADWEVTFRKHLEEVGVLTSDPSRIVFARGGRANVASLSALSVAGEILDEYRAIEEGDLAEDIRLEGFDGCEAFRWLGWQGSGCPRELTMLWSFEEEAV